MWQTPSIIVLLYLVTTVSCLDTYSGGKTSYLKLNTKWKTKNNTTQPASGDTIRSSFINNYPKKYYHSGDSTVMVAPSAVHRKVLPSSHHHTVSTVSPWMTHNRHHRRKSFGPFTSTSTTTTTTTTSTTTSKPRMKTYNVKLRHQTTPIASRYPTLDNVLNRLDRITTSTRRPKYGDDVLDEDEDQDEYGWDEEEEDNDYLLDAEEDTLTDDDYLEDVTDDDEVDTGGQSVDTWLSEEPTETVTKSAFTDYKWRMYGTRDRVEETRRNYLQSNPSRGGISAVNAEVYNHISRVKNESQCGKPRPRVISVFNEHPGDGAGLQYIPHCTVLHRCAEDTGCCQSHDLRCAAKTQTQVHLYFFVSSSSSKTGNKVVKLPFYNHTQCACVAKDSTAPIFEETVTQSSSVDTTYHHRMGKSNFPTSSQANELAAANFRRCPCPEEFLPKIRPTDNRCRCDCNSSNTDCIRMKKGMEYLSLKDRTCIDTNKCGVPICEYGAYLRDTGRCPKLEEKFAASASVNINRN